MKNLFRNTFSILLLLFSLFVTAQEQSFYIRSLRSISLMQDTLSMKPITFKEVDIVYNKIIDFTDNKIKIKQAGKYEVNGFVNINPGVYATAKDSIQIEVYWYKNYNKDNQEKLQVVKHNYSYGNLDVARTFLFMPQTFYFLPEDEISVWVSILPTSTISVNSNKNYHQITKPTGVQQITALRIAREE